jgi:hypothetical protein
METLIPRVATISEVKARCDEIDRIMRDLANERRALGQKLDHMLFGAAHRAVSDIRGVQPIVVPTCNGFENSNPLNNSDKTQLPDSVSGRR